MGKPKRAGEYVTYYPPIGQTELPPDRDPYYTYRDYIIARGRGIANGKEFHYEIYERIEDGKPRGYDFHLNTPDGFSHLSSAADRIDTWLDKKE